MRDILKGGLPPALRGHFDAFWRAYPPRRPNPRALAEAAFARAVAAGADPEDLSRAATAYAAECKARGISEAFVVHARTFLAQRRWQDYLVAPEATPAAEAGPDHDLWQLLRHRISPTDFRAWIEPLSVVAWTQGERALLCAPSRFHRDWVRRHHLASLQAAMGVGELLVEIAEDCPT